MSFFNFTLYYFAAQRHKLTYHCLCAHVGYSYYECNISQMLNQSTGWPKKVSHNRESSLNRINSRQQG